MFIRKKKGQSILEYAVFLGVIIAVIIVMQIYVKRAIQGKFKSNADQLGDQFSTGVVHNIETMTQTDRKDNTQSGTILTDPAMVNVVEKSEIGTEADAAWATRLDEYAPGAANYKGAEIKKTDFVDAAGGHSQMNSGVLKEKTLFGDDE